MIVVALLAVAVTSELRMSRIPREDPLGRQLLYLPSPEMLKLLSLGNPGLAADVLYLWSIQYYSKFRPHERFLYLETVYNLITDLDPLGRDVVGPDERDEGDLPAGRTRTIGQESERPVQPFGGGPDLTEIAVVRSEGEPDAMVAVVGRRVGILRRAGE